MKEHTWVQVGRSRLLEGTVSHVDQHTLHREGWWHTDLGRKSANDLSMLDLLDMEGTLTP